MSSWTEAEVARIATADDLHISPFREDGVTHGTPTWIWSVVGDGALYVRAYNGRNSSWYKAAMTQKAALLDVVLNVLREVEDDSRQLVLKLRLNLVRQLLLGQALGPLVKRLERCKKLDVGKRRCIAPIVRTAMLRHDGNHLRVPQENLAHLPGCRLAVLKRERDGHRGANPEIAFFEVGKEFAAQPRSQKRR